MPCPGLILNSKWMGLEVLERLRFLISLPLAGTALTEGGGIRVANKHFIPYPVNATLTYTNNILNFNLHAHF